MIADWTHRARRSAAALASRARRRWVAAVASAALTLSAFSFLSCMFLSFTPCLAQAPAQGVFVPRFFDPGVRIERPDLTGRTLRVLTDDDYPPFNFLAPDGALVGFNVDLARAVCAELEVACTIQPRRFDTLVEALAQNEGDVVVASLASNPALRRRIDFSEPYYRTPARFVARAGAAFEATPEAMAGRRVAVEAGGAHESYLKSFFPEVAITSYGTAAAARAALRSGDVEALFGDGVSLALWLNGTDSGGCCGFLGGPFTESRWFGEGVAIALRKGDPALKRGLDWALRRLDARGATAELYLKYFPIGFY